MESKMIPSRLLSGVAVAALSLFGAHSLVAQTNMGAISEQMADSQTAVSWPKDGRFLFDQIDVEVYLVATDPKPAFSISTRPSQMLYISLPVEGSEDLVRKYAYVFSIEIDGKAVSDYSELEKVREADIRFRIMPFCLEETPEGAVGGSVQPAQLDQVGGCSPRSKLGPLRDDLRIGVELVGVQAGQKAEPAQPGGVVFKVTNYQRQSFSGFKYVGPMAKCCGQLNGVEVCACKVLGGEEPCRVGCK